MKDILLASAVQDKFERAQSPIYRLLKHCHFPYFHLSSYQNGQHYGYHQDINEPSNLTIVLFLCKEPKKFSGGSFIINRGGHKKTIRCKNNRLLIFPSNTFHKVTPVRMNSKRFDHGRFSIQIWPRVKSSATKLNTYRASNKNAYYTPRFEIAKRVWSRLGTNKSDRQENFNRVVRQLTSNLKYIGRSVSFGHPQLFSTKFIQGPGRENGRLYVSCSTSYRGKKVSFGYFIESHGRNLALNLFLSILDPAAEPHEHSIAISPQTPFRATISKISRLLAKMDRSSQVADLAAAFRGIAKAS